MSLPKRRIGKFSILYNENFYNDYEFINMLGTGSFSEVKLFRCLRNNKLYAIKEILLEEDPSRTLMTTKREIEIQKLLYEAGMSVPKCYGIFCCEVSNRIILCVVMEYINGESLTNCKDVNITSLISWLILTVKGLQDNGIVHKDIKEDNILYDKQKNMFFLIDFGLSVNTRLNRGDNLNSLTRGSPYYFSPSLIKIIREIQDGYKIDDDSIINVLKESDVWAMGITLYSYVQGKYPYVDTTNCQKLFNSIVCTTQKIEIETEDKAFEELIKLILNKTNIPTIDKILEFYS